MELSFENIETVIRALDMSKKAMRQLLKMPFSDAVAIASFVGTNTEALEDADPQEFRNNILMQLSDIDKAREAIREITGL